IPTRFRTSSSVAVDGTDLETWGALHGDCTTVELDGEAAETQLMEETPTKRRAVRKARVLGIGADGRKQYTVDRDARAGHRSATHQRGTKPFSGDALLIDGQLFSPLLPEELRDLPVPPRGAPEEEKLAYEAKFNQRARWRLSGRQRGGGGKPAVSAGMPSPS